MTSVYGVTYIGARMQILNRLKERNPTAAADPVDTYRAACYAAKVRCSISLSAMELQTLELIKFFSRSQPLKDFDVLI